MNYKEILSKICKHYRYEKKHRLLFHNCYPHYWFETDFLTINNNDFMYEFEIKLFVADFKHDFIKKVKHNWLSGQRTGIITVDKMKGSKYSGFNKDEDGKINLEYSYDLSTLKGPNYFYYVVPENLIKVEDIPVYSGLIYVYDNGWCRIIKTAPKLHKNKVDNDIKNQLFKSLMYKYWNIIEKSSCNLDKN